MDLSLWVWIISITVTIFFLLGVPVFLVIAHWALAMTLVLGLRIDNVGAALSDVFTDGFALLAMPLFILTGDLIGRSGIARRLSDFAYACLGWLRGGLAMAALGASGLFAAISGSNSATTATIGSMLHPEMVRGGYDPRFSAATAAAGGTVGIIIPPSIIFIVYGFLLNLPISELFIAGILPGVLMVTAMILVAFTVSTRKKWGILIRLDAKRVIYSAVGAWLGFFAIGLVLWGIYTGKFSPTEAAAVTVAFCALAGFVCLPLHHLIGAEEIARPGPESAEDEMNLSADSGQSLSTEAEPNLSAKAEMAGEAVKAGGIGEADQASQADQFGQASRAVQESPRLLSMLVVRGFSPLELPSITMRSARITGILAPLIAVSVVMQQILSVLGAQTAIGDFVTSTGGYYPVLFTSMAIVFVAGMVLESLPVTIILAPILAPAAASVGIDPIQFAVVFLVGASIGFITPPYGLNLYVASGVTGVPYFRLLRFAFLYLFALITVWVTVALVPVISTLLVPGR